ncbi:hypothetical protein C8R43DRAFT_1065664 [Mycena crocata]|nr:hypothetical protein C8R43DRAFT_1065664 [Mycena crocata]
MSSRSRAAGLPSGPGPRSRSVARTREDNSSRYDNDSDGGASTRSSARQVRPQKSMTSMNQTRSGSRPPPMPSSRSRHNPAPSYDARSDSGSGTNRSSDSTTSSGSSFFDRMKASAGYASSRTSLEDDEPDNKRSMRSRPSRRGDSPPPQEHDTPGDGYTLWSKVASAAGSLTVNVGKAWATNITTFAGEETPVGQESRLTRAMKAYHLEKARDPTDLPAWLFDASERRRTAPEPSRSRRRDDDYDDYEVVEKKRTAEPPPSRGLRDIYDAAATSSSSTPSMRSTRGPRNYADDTPQPSKATDRLKALRDAKRTAVAPASLREEPGRQSRDASRAEREPESAQPARRRVGLPSGPVSRRI